MKPKDEAIPILIHYATDEFGMINLYNLVDKSIEWAWQHPHWISVEDELPKIGWTMSDTVVVTDGNGGLRLAWYHQDEGWHFGTGLPFEPTHWMPLPQAPLVTDLNKKDLPPVSCQEGNILVEEEGGEND